MKKNLEIEQKIIETSIQEFSTYGYAGTFLENIAVKVGISRQPLYYYFGNKAELYLACTHYILEKSYKAYEQVFQLDKPILDVIKEDYKICLSNVEFFSTFDEIAKGKPEVSELKLKLNDWLVHKKREVFKHAIETKQLKPDTNVDELITFIYIYFGGVQYTLNIAKNVEGFDKNLLQDSTEYLLDIIKKEYINEK